MPHFDLAFIGFGNVAKALLHLLSEKQTLLRTHYDTTFRLAGIATRSQGFRCIPPDTPLPLLLADDARATLARAPRVDDLPTFLAATRPAVLFELSSLNPHTGQPAIETLRAALRAGAHVVSANKGPVVHGYHELSALARETRRHFLFEATCLAGAPFFSLFRDTRPVCRLTGFRGIVNVTANLILHQMEQGQSFDDAVRHTQQLGLAETDPSHDVDGWDAAAKIAIVATVLLHSPTTPNAVAREGIRNVTPDRLRAARAAGQSIRLVATAQNDGGTIRTSVAPEALAPNDPLLAAGPDGLIATCTTDTTPPITIAAHGITPVSTAYDVLADFLHIARHPAPQYSLSL